MYLAIFCKVQKRFAAIVANDKFPEERFCAAFLRVLNRATPAITRWNPGGKHAGSWNFPHKKPKKKKKNTKKMKIESSLCFFGFLECLVFYFGKRRRARERRREVEDVLKTD